jgi:hypothetical protein
VVIRDRTTGRSYTPADTYRLLHDAGLDDLRSIVRQYLLAIPALAASGATTHRNVHFTEAEVGAGIGKNRTVYKIHDSVMGNGASVDTTTFNAQVGTSTSVTYYGDAKAYSKDTFTLGKPQTGLIPFSGSGHHFRGTGKLKGLHSSYTFTGSYDPKTTITHVTVTGTESYQ